MVPDGRLLVAAGGQLAALSPGETERSQLGTVADGRLELSISGRWLAVVGETVVVTELGGEEAWSGPADVAGWVGDRLLVLHEGVVRELHPVKAELTEVGPPPHAGEGGSFEVFPDGTWAFRAGDRLTLHPASQLRADHAIPAPIVELTAGTTHVRWLDQRRLLTFSGAGMELIEAAEKTPLQGDLVGSAESDRLRRLHP
jgi:hypothetical protein